MARLIALLLVLGAGSAMPGQRRAPADVRWLDALLDSYADDDPALFDRHLTGVLSDTPVRLWGLTRALEKAAPAWVAQAPPERRDFRRLVAAAVALHAANEGGLGEWPSARAAIEWGCALARKNTPGGPAERTLHWGAIAVLEGAADASPLQAHVGHALERFPGDPRFVLARAVATELRTWPDPRDGLTPRERDPALTGLIISRLNDAARIDDVRAEALVRLGLMAIRNGDASEALPYLRDAAAARPDPFVAHLLDLFRGRALERLDRLVEAIAAYRSAARAAEGQTARLALAAALAKAGDRGEALAARATALGTTGSAGDPWITYGRSDARFWPDIARRLRDQIRELR